MFGYATSVYAHILHLCMEVYLYKCSNNNSCNKRDICITEINISISVTVIVIVPLATAVTVAVVVASILVVQGTLPQCDIVHPQHNSQRLCAVHKYTHGNTPDVYEQAESGSFIQTY